MPNLTRKVLRWTPCPRRSARGRSHVRPALSLAPGAAGRGRHPALAHRCRRAHRPGPLAFLWPQDRPGWYVSWSVQPAEGYRPFPDAASLRMDAPEYRRLGMEFVPLVKMLDGRLYHAPADLTTMAANNPGRTWIIGNEPDVAWQDNTTAADYACAYHDAYHAIKAGDPKAQVAINGQPGDAAAAHLSQPHLGKLSQRVRRTMPVDIWTMHAYVLREELGNWGVGIPPGFEYVTRGVLWDIEDHDNLELVENQIRLMRSWIAPRSTGQAAVGDRVRHPPAASTATTRRASPISWLTASRFLTRCVMRLEHARRR
ncbi:MAG: hypothetical protein R3A10_04220 [Caldilineaceae bacterium]